MDFFLKKFFALLLSLIIILQQNTWIVLAAGDFSISTFKIKNVDTPDFSFYPGERFSIEFFSANNLPESIQNVFIKADFGNNAGFGYDGIDQRSRINGVVIENPVPANAYNSTTGLNYELTTAGTPQVSTLQDFNFTRSSNTHTGFYVSSSISTYSNTLTAYFEAKKVSDGSTVIGDSITRTIYANVKPHITDYYFEKWDGSTATNQIQGDQAESINLVLKVKDYNSCTNIDGGVVTADLSSLGFTNAEQLIYTSCEVDGNTAIFKKTGITTLASMGDKTFSYTHFSARDEDNNQNDPTDPNTTFDDEDKKSNLVLTVIPASAPSVSIISVSDATIGGPSKPSSTISFSGSQWGEIKIALGSDGSCAGGTALMDWTGLWSYAANTATGITIASTSLSDGSNAVYFCVRNSGGNIGSAQVSLTKDTVSPTLTNFVVSPANVITNDANTSYRCSENGIYQVELGGGGIFGAGTHIGSGSAIANTTVNQLIGNGLLADGSNTIYVFCRDTASNTAYSTGNINKTPPTPSMAGQAISFSDSDTDNDGLDGRDINFTWNNTNAVGFSAFESYRIYLLPAATAFNSGSQAHIKILTDKNLSSWTGDATLTKDSLNATLVSGASYKMCIAIMGTSGQLGTEGCTSGSVVTADTVSHPIALFARFTSDTNLEVTTDATLDTALSSHSGALISFVRNSNTVYATSIASVSGKVINFTIPSLGSIAATGSTLVMQTGAIRANGGGYNNYFSSGWLVITDGQAPTVSAFSKTTAAAYGNFHKGSVSFDYTFGEGMSGGGNTRLEFSRTSGNTDGTSKVVNLTAPSELTAGSHSKTIDLNSLSLVSGTTYRVQIVGRDIAGNTVNSAYINNVSYDNTGPAAPSLTDATVFSTLTPTLSWLSSLDDSGNGSGIAKYVLRVYSGNACNIGNLTQTHDPITSGSTSRVLNTLPTNPGAYSWNLYAIDNMWNTGAVASCDDFLVDTSIPTITSQSILDQTIASTTYAKSTDSIRATANIVNTDSAHIWADLSALMGSGAYNNVLCSSPGSWVSCSYSGTTVTYSFLLASAGTVNDGTRQVQIRAQNTAGLNEQTALASITVDNTAPSVSVNTITSPNGGEIWWGASRNITWNPASITDSVGISHIRLEYSTGAGSWNLIATWSNAGNYTWDITSMPSRNDYTIRITAYDPVGNTASDTSNAVFSIDRTAPTVPPNTLLTPNWGSAYRGGQAVTITWDSGSIVDAGGLQANPITLEYSTNSGAHWTSIASGLPNNGTYNWTIPGTNATGWLVRITATDTAGNTTSDQSDTRFIIDSINPMQAIAYAGWGGNTPQDGRKINSSGIDITASITDSFLDAVYYQLANTTDGLYWHNGSASWLGVDTWNLLCADGANLGTDLSCSSLSTTISPTILNGKNYTLVMRSTDEAGNSTTSITHSYIGDIVAPTLSVSTASGSYLSGSILISGTSSDSGSNISAVQIQIQKGAQYWNGSAWVGSAQSLLTSTANSYADWSYALTPPLSDSDGQDYVVTVTAYDTAYKINNSTVSSLTIIKDATWPVIASDIFTFDVATLYKGGDILTITWDPAKITSVGAWLAPNPITLSTNLTGTIVTLASDIANNGSYNYNIPSIDSNTAKIIIRAVDTLGNESNSVSSNSFSIDSLPPQISSVTTMDQDLNGQIDAIQIQMTESIVDNTVTLANFTISSGIGIPTGFQTGLSANDDTFVLTFPNSGNTGTTPTVSYTEGTLADGAGNRLATVSGIASTDGAEPRIQDVRAFDTNGNGKFDQMKVRFGETMASTTSNAFTINNTIAGLSIASISRDETDLATFNITLNESAAVDTGIGSMTLSFVNNSNYRDVANNSAVNFANQAIIDVAKPVIVSARTVDSNANHKVDRVELIFSEILLGNTDSELSLGALATGSSKGASSIAGTSLRIIVNETSNDHDTDLVPNFSYSGTNLRDAAWNLVDLISNHAISDGVSPKLISRLTRDIDGNGKIDALRLTFSEGLNTNTSTLNVSAGVYSVSGYDSLCEGSSSDDGVICVLLTEKPTTDTDATPTMQILSNTTLADASGNLALNEWGATTVTDGAGPVMIGARYDEGSAGVSDDAIYLTFSESLSGSSLSSNPISDFLLSDGGAFGGASSMSYISGNTGTIILGAWATPLTAWTSKISFQSAAVSDSFGNPSPTEWAHNRVTVTSSVIINEVMWSSTGTSAHQYIELKNIGTSSVNINGWILENAWGNGVDITLPNDSIPGNSLYLIAKNTEASSLLDITPSFVSNTLNLNPVSQNNLVLKNGTVIYDTARANPWPFGNDLLISMERKNPAGDGTIAASWYEAQTGSGFDIGSDAKGTPGSENIFDAVSPTITWYSPTSNILLPLSPDEITFQYSDAGGSLIDGASDTLVLEKWNGTAFVDVTLTYVNTAGKSLTQTGARYPLFAAPFGKYRSIFSISDGAGNVTEQTIDFYIDRVELSISGNGSDLGILPVWNLHIGETEVVITIKTVGAGFSLTHEKIGTFAFSGGITSIGDWDNTSGYGFDYAESGSGGTRAYANTIDAINNTVIGNYSAAIDPNGNQKTYIYRVKYGARIVATQAAGVYSGSAQYRVDLNY